MARNHTDALAHQYAQGKEDPERLEAYIENASGVVEGPSGGSSASPSQLGAAERLAEIAVTTDHRELGIGSERR